MISFGSQRRFGRGGTALVLMVVLIWGIPSVSEGKRKAEQHKEHEIKAALLYNFLKFIDWPEEKKAGEKQKEDKGAKGQKQKFTIGVFGKNAFDCFSKTIKGKCFKNKEIDVIEVTKSDIKKKDKLRTCQSLFFSKSSDVAISEINKLISKLPVLTVGESKGFLEKGGIINFVIKKKKVCFEFNLIAAEKAGLKARSKFLRLAKRVVKDKKSGKAN